MTDSQHLIQQVDNLLEFFRSELSSAFETLGSNTTEETQTYLVYLLESFVRLDKKKAQDIGFQKPAAFILGDALNSAGDRRIEAYRRLGDASLFSCGFFEEHLERSNSVVALDYYKEMGRNAYSNLQSLMEFKAPGGAFCVIYDELTHKFDTVVEAFQVLANRRDAPSCAHLLERWQQSGQFDADAWSKAGLFPGGEGGNA